jgi:hypothetical protein
MLAHAAKRSEETSMISDVLSEAVDEIRRYLDDPVFANAYRDDIREEIERVLAQMEVLRATLDAPP